MESQEGDCKEESSSKRVEGLEPSKRSFIGLKSKFGTLDVKPYSLNS